MDKFALAFGLNWKLLVIQLVNFGALLALLSYFLYKPVLKMLDERREKIAEGVRTAQEADRRLADAKKEGDEMIGTAAREAEALVAHARSRADEKGTEIVSAAEEKAQRMITEANARAEEAKRQALMESQKEITRAAVLAAEKVLRGSTR